MSLVALSGLPVDLQKGGWILLEVTLYLFCHFCSCWVLWGVCFAPFEDFLGRLVWCMIHLFWFLCIIVDRTSAYSSTVHVLWSATLCQRRLGLSMGWQHYTWWMIHTNPEPEYQNNLNSRLSLFSIVRVNRWVGSFKYKAGIQVVIWIPDPFCVAFRCHLNIAPFKDKTALDHLNTGLFLC